LFIGRISKEVIANTLQLSVVNGQPHEPFSFKPCLTFAIKMLHKDHHSSCI